jgi:hypothetical protein
MRNARNRVVVDVVEELRDVHVHHPVLSSLRILLCGFDGVLRATPRSKPVTVLTELRIEDRRQRLQQQLLNKPPVAGPFRRSCTVGIPSIRVPPLGLGISTRLTGLGT